MLWCTLQSFLLICRGGGRGEVSGAYARQCWMDPLIAQVNESVSTCAAGDPTEPTTCRKTLSYAKDITFHSIICDLWPTSRKPRFMHRNVSSNRSVSFRCFCAWNGFFQNGTVELLACVTFKFIIYIKRKEYMT